MSTVTAGRPMATKRNDVTVKLDAGVVRKAKAVASLLDLTLAEYLSDLIRPLVDRDLDQQYAKTQKPAKDKGGK